MANGGRGGKGGRGEIKIGAGMASRFASLDMCAFLFVGFSNVVHSVFA